MQVPMQVSKSNKKDRFFRGGFFDFRCFCVVFYRKLNSSSQVKKIMYNNVTKNVTVTTELNLDMSRDTYLGTTLVWRHKYECIAWKIDEKKWGWTIRQILGPSVMIRLLVTWLFQLHKLDFWNFWNFILLCDYNDVIVYTKNVW